MSANNGLGEAMHRNLVRTTIDQILPQKYKKWRTSFNPSLTVK